MDHVVDLELGAKIVGHRDIEHRGGNGFALFLRDVGDPASLVLLIRRIVDFSYHRGAEQRHETGGIIDQLHVRAAVGKCRDASSNGSCISAFHEGTP